MLPIQENIPPTPTDTIQIRIPLCAVLPTIIQVLEHTQAWYLPHPHRLMQHLPPAGTHTFRTTTRVERLEPVLVVGP